MALAQIKRHRLARQKAAVWPQRYSRQLKVLGLTGEDAARYAERIGVIIELLWLELEVGEQEWAARKARSFKVAQRGGAWAERLPAALQQLAAQHRYKRETRVLSEQHSYAILQRYYEVVARKQNWPAPFASY